MKKSGEVSLFTHEECDILYEALMCLRHRNLEIMTNYGTKAINGKAAADQLKQIDYLKRMIYPETTRRQYV